MRKLSVVLLGAALIHPAGVAGACRYDGTQAEMNDCAHRDFQQADRDLNRMYRSLLGTLSAGGRRQLEREQAQWWRTRDRVCRGEAAREAGGGSMEPMIYEICREQRTRERTAALRRWQP
jgi:uncharacterized protein YecT (DUF1311 family)